MTDRCDAATRRPRDYSSNDASCEPTREQAAASSATAQQAADREAEARRDAYIASGADEGGRSMHASSDLGAMQTATPDDKTLRIINNAMKYDPKIESDPLGNALIGIAAGGVFGGIEAGAARFATQEAGELAKGAAKGAAIAAAKAVRNAAVVEGAKASARGIAEPGAGAGGVAEPMAGARAHDLGAAARSTATPAIAGQSSRSGASVPVAEPSRSEGPRIPEALSPAPVRIQG